MRLRCRSWREVHPSCGGQWHITQGEEMHHTWLLRMSISKDTHDAHAKRGHACVVLKQKALLNPVLISLFQWRTTGKHIVHARLIFLLQSTSFDLLVYLILIPKIICHERREREGRECQWHLSLQSPAAFCLTGSSLSPSGPGSGVSLSPLRKTKFAGR